MRKNLLPCLSVSEPLSSVLNAWPKETKSGSMSWCWLCWRQFFFFQRLWISVFQCTRLGSSIKKRGGGAWGHGEATNEVLCPFFLYLFIYCYLLWLFCWNSFVRPNPGWDTSHPSLTRSCIAQKILAQHLHIPKRLSMGCVSSFGDSSSNAFFAHVTPSGTAIIQAHSILRGREKGTKQRRSQGV